ncbi:MAG: hypothetical protein LBU18_05755 [Treponema sp.]|nr:hypothetical protein [Treponema sp.]
MEREMEVREPTASGSDPPPPPGRERHGYTDKAARVLEQGRGAGGFRAGRGGVGTRGEHCDGSERREDVELRPPVSGQRLFWNR